MESRKEQLTVNELSAYLTLTLQICTDEKRDRVRPAWAGVSTASDRSQPTFKVCEILAVANTGADGVP